jgi:hypothetical protein
MNVHMVLTGPGGGTWDIAVGEARAARPLSQSSPMRSGPAGWPATWPSPAELDLHISGDPAVHPGCWLRFRHSHPANSRTHQPGDPALPPATYLYWWLRGCPRMKLKGGIQVMSVLVIAKFQGDVARFRQALADHGGDFAKMAENARTSGGGTPSLRSRRRLRRRG